jgi:hypothetical protein
MLPRGRHSAPWIILPRSGLGEKSEGWVSVGLKNAETRRGYRPGKVGAAVLRLSMIEGRLRSVPALLTPAMLAARSIPVLRLCVK